MVKSGSKLTTLLVGRPPSRGEARVDLDIVSEVLRLSHVALRRGAEAIFEVLLYKARRFRSFCAVVDCRLSAGRGLALEGLGAKRERAVATDQIHMSISRYTFQRTEC